MVALAARPSDVLFAGKSSDLGTGVDGAEAARTAACTTRGDKAGLVGRYGDLDRGEVGMTPKLSAGNFGMSMLHWCAAKIHGVRW